MRINNSVRVKISIHALREEGDSSRLHKALAAINFYPRPPRGGRLLWRFDSVHLHQFLSTPSARRATRFALKIQRNNKFLSTPSARRATSIVVGVDHMADISIHALREEGD